MGKIREEKETSVLSNFSSEEQTWTHKAGHCLNLGQFAGFSSKLGRIRHRIAH